MPSWLWTLIIFLIIAPLHLLLVEPLVQGQPTLTRISLAGIYLALGIIWSIIGDITGMVRR